MIERNLREDPQAWRLEDDGACFIFGALIKGISSVIGSGLQYGAEEDAIKLQKSIFQQTEKDLSPFVGAGPSAVSGIQNLLGMGPQGMAGALASLQATPGYQFALQQGTNAIVDQASATGGIGGGNTLKALMNYGTGLASQTYQQDIGNMFNLASLSEDAAARQGAIGVNTGANIADAYSNLGNAGAGLLGNIGSGLGPQIAALFGSQAASQAPTITSGIAPVSGIQWGQTGTLSPPLSYPGS